MALTADDLWPLVAKLPRAERLRLARLAMSARGPGPAVDDGAAYSAAPVADDELSLADDPLGWEAEGWDDFQWGAALFSRRSHST